MPHDGSVQPPIGCRWLIRLAAWIVPRRARSAWLARWESGLRNWWILVERGELAGGGSALTVRECWSALADAFRLRLTPEQFRYYLRGPAFLVMAAAALLLVMAGLTHGFETTRAVIAIARHGAVNARQSDLVFGHVAPVVFALAIGIVLVAVGRLSLHRYGWRYWIFLAVKTAAILVAVPVLWTEAGSVLRAHLPAGNLRVLLGGVAFTLVFFFAFGWALWWSFADQRQRCPVCLHRLAMPVSIGSWASVFEPASTELLCDEGHGSLCVSEAGNGTPDRWTPLDASWHELFAKKRV